MMVMLNLAGVPFCWNDRERGGGGGGRFNPRTKEKQPWQECKSRQLSGCQHISGSYPICATWEENMELVHLTHVLMQFKYVQ